MFKRDLMLAAMIAVGITATSVSAHPWTRVVQNEDVLCRFIEGEYIPYMVDRKNGQGETVTLSFDSSAQRQLCKIVSQFPR